MEYLLLPACILVAIGFGFACEWFFARIPARAAVPRRPSSPPAFVHDLVDGFVDLARMAVTVALWLAILLGILGGAVLLAATFGVTPIVIWITGLLGTAILGLFVGAKLDSDGDAIIPTMLGAILLFVCLRLWFG